MSFMDKLKSTVKSGAEQAATRAQEELERLQTRRELGQAYGDLGEKTFNLVDRGELSHPALGDLIEHVRRLRAQLEAAPAEPAAEAATPAPEGSSEAPPAT